MLSKGFRHTIQPSSHLLAPFSLIATENLLTLFFSTFNTFNTNTQRRSLHKMASSSSSSSDSNPHHFNYFVIGGGSGGMASARRAASYKAKTALVEMARMGGTCVNVGCVPKKVMWNCAEIADTLHHAHEYGFDIKAVPFHWGKIKASRDAYIARLNGIYHKNLENSGITELHGKAKLVGNKKVLVNGVEYTADHILIATGGRPKVPNVPGAEYGITSDGFFELPELPKKVAVLGAGYIAIELAGILNHLGSDVSLFIRYDEFLRNFDAMLRQTLAEEMKGQGLKVVPHTVAKELTKDKDGKITLHTEDGKSYEGFDTLIWAVGRTPNVEDLGLEENGIKLNEKGYIQVDEYQNTTAEGVHALGDVCGHIELTPVAIAAGRRLSNRLFDGKKDSKLDYNLVPSIIFSHPPIGTTGLTEEAARKKYGDANIKVYTSKFVNMFYSVCEKKKQDRYETGLLAPRGKNCRTTFDWYWF
eukprot:TRINITY_DN7031_c0_g1_i1.p1 TRINITY_DN7031_c0_g1~~TRINITY_DN7031_c0_g1_i1.p1  ORF type:complete len:474 (+),score=100.52 TRINITY_DN7031_c0_g1_i1:66-1487(+)